MPGAGAEAMKAPMSTAKAEDTRKRILQAALGLFQTRGFDDTTMREIAQAAGVATGAAYYYFASKEAMVMAFYELASREMQPGIAEALAERGSLEEHLRRLIETKLRYFEPNRVLLGALLRHATDPRHPLSPFSQETRAIREADIEAFALALTASETRVPKDLAGPLPRLLWMFQLALIFFWITDHSAAQVRTHKLLERSVRLVANLIKLAGLPLMRPLRKTVLDLIEIVETP
ncbi:MAG TPA: TetR family transcriptional regulator [Bryobacteraceae bacterium]|nr:TetR family transcriptional regulator [Bryobacteraceae bacterium]